MTPAAFTLRDYQVGALAAVWSAFHAGQNRLLVKKPTGTGKTVFFAALPQYEPVRAWLETYPRDDRKMLVIAHREELLDQAAEKIQKTNPMARVAVEQADRYATALTDIVVASIQTLAAQKFRRLRRLLERGTFRIVVVDEAHHAAAASYRTALAHLGFLPGSAAQDDADNIEAPNYDDVEAMGQALAGWDALAPKDRLLLGVTATPNRSDAIGLGCVFQSIAFSYGLKDAIDDGHLVPIVPWVVETDANLDDVRVRAGEFNQKDLSEAVNTSRRNTLAVASWNRYAPGLPTLAFTVDVAHAHELARVFQEGGIRAEALSGETPKEERRSMLQRFRRRELEVITNCMVLTEGTDLPMAECILHAKPTRSATLYEQMTGRGLRPSPGKDRCIVIDLVDVARRHSLQTAPVLYGLPPSIKSQGKDLREAAALVEEIQGRHPGFPFDGLGRLTLEQLRAKAATFDVWTIPDMGPFGEGLALNWIRMGDEEFRIQYPHEDENEILKVEKDLLGHFEVRVSRTSAQKETRGLETMKPRVLAAGVTTARAALQLAEAFVAQERKQAGRLRDRDASWRKRPATPKQIQLLRRFRAPLRPRMTAGEASDLIDMAMARRGRMR